MRGMGLQLESPSEKRDRENIEKEKLIQAAAVIAKENERDDREKQGLYINKKSLDVNRKVLNRTNISLIIAGFSLLVSLFSLLKSLGLL